jgi:hypothetical protein
MALLLDDGEDDMLARAARTSRRRFLAGAKPPMVTP